MPQQHREGPRVSERIDVVSNRHVHAKALTEVPFSIKGLPDERFAIGQIAVWLDPPPVDDGPAPLRDEAPDAREQLRLQLLDPMVHEGFSSCEDEARMRLQQVDRRPAGPDGLGAALRPAPEPDGIQVRVADHVYARGSRPIAPLIHAGAHPSSQLTR